MSTKKTIKITFELKEGEYTVKEDESKSLIVTQNDNLLNKYTDFAASILNHFTEISECENMNFHFKNEYCNYTDKWYKADIEYFLNSDDKHQTLLLQLLLRRRGLPNIDVFDLLQGDLNSKVFQ